MAPRVTFRDLPISRASAPRGVSPPRRSEAPRRRRSGPLRYKTAAMTAMRRWGAFGSGGVGGDNFWVTLQGTRPRPYEKGLLTIGKPGSWWQLKYVFGMFTPKFGEDELILMSRYVSNGLKPATRCVWWFCYAKSWIIYIVLRLLCCFRTNSVLKGYTWLYVLTLRTMWCCFGNMFSRDFPLLRGFWLRFDRWFPMRWP